MNEIETKAVPILLKILQEDITEFIPYVFQLLSQILEAHDNIPESFETLFNPILAPVLWQPKGKLIF